LENAGIDVLNTYSGATTCLSFPAVCGGATGDIITHEIRKANLSNANKIGYENIAILVARENMLGHEINDCEDT
jgi:hypothetical protein